jgi:hypothetical protein
VVGAQPEGEQDREHDGHAAASQNTQNTGENADQERRRCVEYRHEIVSEEKNWTKRLLPAGDRFHNRPRTRPADPG